MLNLYFSNISNYSFVIDFYENIIDEKNARTIIFNSNETQFNVSVNNNTTALYFMLREFNGESINEDKRYEYFILNKIADEVIFNIIDNKLYITNEFNDKLHLQSKIVVFKLCNESYYFIYLFIFILLLVILLFLLKKSFK